MNKIARLIITLDCNKKCSYCCNTPKMLASATRINNLSALKNYDGICITGGEPMLNPNRTANIIVELSSYNKPLYLYTALFHPELYTIIPFLKGIQYTLHTGCTDIDLQSLLYMEGLIPQFPEKSYRLYIQKDIDQQIHIVPSFWDRLEIKDWIEDCPLPKNETLFILESNNEETK